MSEWGYHILTYYKTKNTVRHSVTNYDLQYINQRGDTLEGDLNANNLFSIVDLRHPINEGDATSKAFVMEQINNENILKSDKDIDCNNHKIVNVEQIELDFSPFASNHAITQEYFWNNIDLSNNKVYRVKQLTVADDPQNESDVVNLKTLRIAFNNLMLKIDLKEEILEFSNKVGSDLWIPWVLQTLGGLDVNNFFRSSNTKTPSSGTGPGNLPPIGNYYAFTESSSPNHGVGKVAIATRYLAYVYSIQFHYHRFGLDVGDFRVEYYNGSEWIVKLTLTGQTHSSHNDSWSEAFISFHDNDEYKQVQKIRFYWDPCQGYRSDMGISNIRITYLDSINA